MPWKPEVLVSGKWSRNALVFATETEAQQNAADLMMRWFAVDDSRAIEVDEPVTHTYADRQLAAIELGEPAYERDRAARPTYHDGSPRPSWADLSAIARTSWLKEPRP